MKDTAGFKMVAKVLDQYADRAEKATAHRQLAVLANRFPEYSPLLSKARKLIDGRD